MGSRTQTQSWGRPESSEGLSEGLSPGRDEVSRLWVGLEQQQEVLGPIAVELMALLCPDPDGLAPAASGTGITSRE